MSGRRARSRHSDVDPVAAQPVGVHGVRESRERRDTRRRTARNDVTVDVDRLCPLGAMRSPDVTGESSSELSAGTLIAARHPSSGCGRASGSPENMAVRPHGWRTGQGGMQVCVTPIVTSSSHLSEVWAG